MSKAWIGVAVAVVVVLMLGVAAVGQYNGLVQRREGVDAAWAQVENVLQRRADLIPNLVETVRGYAAHEREVFTAVADARSRLLGARTPSEAAAANGQLDSALGRLLVISEQYPQLRASENFTRLQDELSGTENRIAVERMRYNETVRGYNGSIQVFPTNLFAGLFGFTRRDYFEIAESAREAPRVDFGAREP
jgi:LemA protein